MKWLVAAWLIAVLGAAGGVAHYKLSPGAAAEAPARWPAQSALPHHPGRPTVLVLLHPLCPCSEATVNELAKTLTTLPAGVDVVALFAIDEGLTGWEDGAAWKRAHQLSGLTVVIDRGAAEASRFGSFTSGQVLLYGADGRLQFSGGITGGRGHQGDNPGEQRLLALLKGEAVEVATAPVFGCELHGGKGTR